MTLQKVHCYGLCNDKYKAEQVRVHFAVVNLLVWILIVVSHLKAKSRKKGCLKESETEYPGTQALESDQCKFTSGSAFTIVQPGTSYFILLMTSSLLWKMEIIIPTSYLKFESEMKLPMVIA